MNPDGLDTPGHYSSAADVTKLARVAMNKPFIRETVSLVTATAAGRPLRNWNDLLSSFPNVIGVKTGHTNGAGWSQVAAARGGGVTIYATVLGGETRAGRNADLSEFLAWGPRATGPCGRSTASACTARRAPPTRGTESGSSPRSRPSA